MDEEIFSKFERIKLRFFFFLTAKPETRNLWKFSWEIQTQITKQRITQN